MANLPQLVRDGFKKVSEAAMDAVVTSIVANQEQHLSHLQDMQKWGIVKIVQRLTSYKYLHQQPCVIRAGDWSLFDCLTAAGDTGGKTAASSSDGEAMDLAGEEGAAATTTAAAVPTVELSEGKEHAKYPLAYRPFRAPSLGKLVLVVRCARMILLGHSVSLRETEASRYEWKVVVSAGSGTVETRRTCLSKSQPVASLADTGRSARAKRETFNDLVWNIELHLENITDLWADVCVEVCWRRAQTAGVVDDKWSQSHLQAATGCHSGLTAAPVSPAGRIGQGTDSSHRYGLDVVNELPKESLLPSFSPFLGTPLQSLSHGSGQEGCFTADRERKIQHTMSTDPSRMKPPQSNDWELYGRAIVPLSVLLNSVGNFCPETESVSSCPTSVPGCGRRRRFWLHLFPHRGSEKKYYRPVAGYPGFGMPNPQTTLGFLEVEVEFVPTVATRFPLLLPFLSVFHAPATRWVTSFSFEPQYLESYGLRARHIMTTYPRWVPKFLHLFSHEGQSDRNTADWWCISVFWVTLVITSLFAPFYCIPVGAMLCILAVSLSYKEGRHKMPSTRHSIRYAWGPNQRVFSTAYNVPASPGNVRAQASDLRLSSWLTATQKSLTAWLLKPEDELERHGTDYPLGTQRLDAVLSYYNKQLADGYGAHCSAIPKVAPVRDDEANPHAAEAADKSRGSQNGRCRTPTPKTVRLPVDFGHEASVSAVGLKTPTVQTAGLGGLLPSGSPKSPSKGLFLWTKTPEPLPWVSVVQSPFGELALSINDPGSYCPSFAVFADDAGDQDIQQLLEHGLELLDVVQVRTFFFAPKTLIFLFCFFQRSTGIMSSTVEKLKFAFNWEDPLMTIASYAILILGALGLSVVFYGASCLPLWIARLPVLFPWFLFASITDPWIQSHFWLAVLGIDIPFLYCALLSRVTLQKARVHHRTSNLSTGQLVEETAAPLVKADDCVASGESGDHGTGNCFAVSAKGYGFSPQRKDGARPNLFTSSVPQPKLKTQESRGTTPSTARGARQQNVAGTLRDESTQMPLQQQYAADSGAQDGVNAELVKPAAPNRFFSIRFDGLWGSGQRSSATAMPSAGGNECGTPGGGAAIATGSSSIEPNRWDTLRNRFAQLMTPGQSQQAAVPVSSGAITSTSGTLSQRSDNGRSLACGIAGDYVAVPQRAVSVLNVTTRVVSAAEDVRKFSYARFLYAAGRGSTRVLVGFRSFIIRINARFSVWERLYPICRKIAYYIMIMFLHILDIVVRLLRHWWLRLPDRREIEHRQIAVSQFVASLERLQSPEGDVVDPTMYGGRSTSVSRAPLFRKSGGEGTDYQIQEGQQGKSVRGNILPAPQGTEHTGFWASQQDNEDVVSSSFTIQQGMPLLLQGETLITGGHSVESDIEKVHKPNAEGHTYLSGQSELDRSCQPEPSPAASLRFSALYPSGLSQLRDRFRRRTLPLKEEPSSPKVSVTPGEASCSGYQSRDTTTTAATAELACSREDSTIEVSVMKEEAASVESQEVLTVVKGRYELDGDFISNAQKEENESCRDSFIDNWTVNEGSVYECGTVYSDTVSSGHFFQECSNNMSDTLLGAYRSVKMSQIITGKQEASKIPVSFAHAGARHSSSDASVSELAVDEHHVLDWVPSEEAAGTLGGTTSQNIDDGYSQASGLGAAAVPLSNLQENMIRGTAANTDSMVTENNLYGLAVNATRAEPSASDPLSHGYPCGVPAISNNVTVCSTVQPQKLNPVKEFFQLLAQKFEKPSTSFLRTSGKEEPPPDK